ncbi:esterase-like activity of phytase family protein [Nonomuraea sp. NN258]|uniref:esterase-like activity of phytase family protein n=1 Tax=Nonomuraea antri TaxID=2730852 RepID=UPI001567D52B|nr:esterase-like activity of phytase family protein [Nonomuraea antri]NRQ34726.1 esterase-like activity of phytase family protein [Nonomuraea antri]
MSRSLIAALAAGSLLAAGLAAPASAATGAGREPRVVSDVTLPAPDLAAFQPGIVTDSRGVKLGGVGSGLYPADRPGEYWMVTDRGPNGEPKIDGEKRRTFPVPAFAPAIVRVAVRHGTARIVRAIPLRKSDGTPISGLSNQAGHDETPYTWDGRTQLPYDPNGLDTEDIVTDGRGGFWLVDEYSPSLVHVGADGRILARYVPKGLGLTGAGYPVHETLPAVFGTRQQNRGLEAVGLSPAERALYVAIQSPLANPDKKTGKASSVARILRVDLRTGRPTGEWAYRMEDAAAFDPAAEQGDMKISALTVLRPGRLLLQERTDAVARLYTVDLRGASDLLGGPHDDPATTPSLEASLPANVRVATKSLAVDLAAIPGLPGKIEGVALLDRRTIAVANDNDFGLGTFGPDGRLIDSGVTSRILTIRLPRPLL